MQQAGYENCCCGTLLHPVTNLSSAKLTAGPPETAPRQQLLVLAKHVFVFPSGGVTDPGLVWGLFTCARGEGWASCSKASAGSGMAYVKSRQLLAFLVDGSGAHEDLRCLSACSYDYAML